MIDYALTDSLQLARRGAAGLTKPSFGSAVTVRCRFQQNLQMVNGPNGELVASDAQAFLPPGTAVQVGDQIIFDGEKWVVQRVARRRALDYEEHVQIWLGRA